MRLVSKASLSASYDAEELGFDVFETGVLAVARHLFLSFVVPEQLRWQTACGIAVERWGANVGLPVAYAVFKLVRALDDARDDFAFHDPACLEMRDRVTDDEALMMQMLHNMRRDETPDARDAVEALTHGQMDPDVIRYGLTLAMRFGRGARVPTSRPALRVVS